MFLQPLKSYLFTKENWPQREGSAKRPGPSELKLEAGSETAESETKRESDQRLPTTCLFSDSERDLIRILHHITKSLPMAEQYAKNADKNRHLHLQEFFADLKESLEIYSAAGYELLFEHPDFQNEKRKKDLHKEEKPRISHLNKWEGNLSEEAY